MSTIVVLCAAAVLIVLDQLLKVWVQTGLSGHASVTVIPGLLQFTYVENRGAAFGIFQGKTVLLSIVTFVVIAALIFAVVKRYFKHNLALWSMGLIIAGGLGNLIDRVFRGYVIDFLDISPLFSFPVFNFADCCVVVGTILYLVYMLFIEGKKGKSDRIEQV